METILSVTDAMCRTAVARYVEAMAQAGIRATLQKVEEEAVVRIDWGGPDGEAAGDRDDNEGATSQDDASLLRLQEHYGRTLVFLSSEPAVAEAWLKRTGGIVEKNT